MALTQTQIEIVLQDVASGIGLRKAAVRADLSSPARWIEAVQADDTLAERYARARAIGLQVIADDIQNIADDREGDPDANSRRLRVDSRKWLLSKLVPKQYGDKLELAHSGSVTGAQALSDAELQAIAARGKIEPTEK